MCWFRKNNRNDELIEKTVLTILEELLSLKQEVTTVKNKIDSVHQILHGVKEQNNKKIIKNGVLKS